MLNRFQKSTVFALFCLFSVLAALAEFYLIIGVVDKGLDFSKGIGAVVLGGVLAGCGKILMEMIRANFLHAPRLPVSRLHRFAAERTKLAKPQPQSGEAEYAERRALIANTLKFAEEVLRGWVKGSHLEFCVFVDREMPLLFSYFDSHHDTHARSMQEREGKPTYYVDRKYEVTKLLQNPTSQPRLINDTSAKDADYSFTSPEQKKQLKSTMLLCLDVNTPCAMVVTSNNEDAFDAKDDELMSFVKYVGELVRYDLFSNDFVHRIRTDRPELFQQNINLTVPIITSPVAVTFPGGQG